MFGPLRPRGSRWAAGSGLASSYKEKTIPSQAHYIDSGLLLKACPPVITGHSKGGNLELEFAKLREEEITRRQQLDLHHSMADRVLEEKAARYGLVMNLGGLRAQGSSSSNFFYFGRAPKREYYDYSGV